jgi:glycosyltransferase involved in cell wall biosynthesis
VAVSIPSSDSSPRSVWESLASGLPTVVSDLPWVHEWIRDREHALVVPPEARSVAGAILPLVRDPALSDELSRAGRRLAEEHMNRDVEMGRAEAIYRSLAP